MMEILLAALVLLPLCARAEDLPDTTANTPAAISAKVMSGLTAFGLFAVSAGLVCYACEDRSVWFILGFAFACALGSIYGFLQGAWPFGLVEAVWTVVAARRWWLARRHETEASAGPPAPAR